MTIPAGTACIFPVNIDGIRYATAQLVARRDGKIYMEQIPGVPTEICVGKKVMKNVKARGLQKPVYGNIYLLDSETAGRLFLDKEAAGAQPQTVTYNKVKEAGPARRITIGVQKVAEEPVDEDFRDAAVYTIDVPAEREGRMLTIDYRGDVARLYADGRLVGDNFYNGRPFQYGLWRLPKDCRKIELRILPLQKDMPVYFPREAKVDAVGEEVNNIKVEDVW